LTWPDRAPSRSALAGETHASNVQASAVRRPHWRRRATGVSSACSTGGRGRSDFMASTNGCRRTPHTPTQAARVERGMASPGALEDSLLAVERQVVRVLGDQHMGEQARRGQALVDDLRRHRCLGQRAAVRAGPLASHMALQREAAGRVVQLLADVLSNACHPAAAMACRVAGFVVSLHTR